jgi:hypothetical protein
LGGEYKDNGSSGNKSASGNQAYSLVAPVAFMDTTFPPDFEYQNLEYWFAQSNYPTHYGHLDSPLYVYYEGGDYAVIPTCEDGDGQLYKCIQPGANMGKNPTSNPGVWEPVAYPTDDLRQALTSPIEYEGMGLLDEAFDIWIGASDSNWDNASNWLSGSVPGSAANVSIPATGNQPEINGAASCKSLVIDTGASLTIASEILYLG